MVTQDTEGAPWRQIRAQLPKVERVDILIGLPSFNNAETVKPVIRAVTTGLRQTFPSASILLVNQDAGSQDGTPELMKDAVEDAFPIALLNGTQSSQTGEPFPRLAGEFSVAASKANGGLIGPLRSDELAQSLSDLLAKMQVGDITEPIRTQRGYQLLKLESRTEAKLRSFEEARGDIGNRIGEQKLRGEREKYLDRLRSQATITWRNAELEKAYNAALAKRRQASSQQASLSQAETPR